MADVAPMTYDAPMADRLDFDTKISPEGRVVLSASARAALGIKPGDRVHVTVVGMEARIMPARALLEAVWSNNHGGDAGDSVRDVRAARRADQTRAAAKWDRVSSAVSSETRSEEDIEAGLLAALGVPQ